MRGHSTTLPRPQSRGLVHKRDFSVGGQPRINGSSLRTLSEKGSLIKCINRNYISLSFTIMVDTLLFVARHGASYEES
jgi:hypothetical protein